MGRDSSVGIAIRYVLDVRELNPGGARFSAFVQASPGTHAACYTVGAGSFSGIKRTGRSVDHSPPFSAEVKERVEVYVYSPSVPSWQVIG